MTDTAQPVALVTGGGTGTGAETAKLLASRGYRVGVNYSRSEAGATQVAEKCRELAGDAMTLKGDVSSDADCRAMVASVTEKWGRLDVLICNAGTTYFSPLDDLENQNADEFYRIYGVNVIGPYQMARAAEPFLRASDHGAIVNTGSNSSQTGIGSSLPYIASKGGLNSLTIALARTLAPEVRVNAVLPGFIDTDWFSKGMDDDAVARTKARASKASALDTVCSPADVADMIVFLALDGKKVTGQLMTVDAGAKIGPAVRR